MAWPGMSAVVAIVKRIVPAPPDRVFAVLADGWTYSDWVVGTVHIRDVDESWPQPGSKLHHKAGPWPFSLKESSEVVSCVPDREMTIIAGLWPLGEADTRVVCDHLRSAIVVVGDGVRPANTGRGYVLRRLLRRVLTLLWRDDPGRTLGVLPAELITHTIAHFGLPVTPPEVRTVLHDEERRFRDLLDRGRRVLSRRLRRGGPLREEDYRDLHDTHGLPRDLVESLLHP